MHTILSRLNALLAFSLSIVALLTLGFALSTSYKSYDKLARIDLKTVKAMVRRMPDYAMPNAVENDLGLVQFNLDADFEECFDWNVKQLFIYLTANYRTPTNVLNQVVLWDYVLNRGEKGQLRLKNQHPEYYLWDDGFGLKGNDNVTLTLSMNIIPNAGFLQVAISPVTHTFSFPDLYIK
jgi:signal peptidase complex subunit 3